MSKPTAVVCAYSSVGTAALEGLLEAGVEVLALYTYAQGADELWFTPPAAVAQAHGIPVHLAPTFNDDVVFEAIRAQQPGLPVQLLLPGDDPGPVPGASPGSAPTTSTAASCPATAAGRPSTGCW